MADDPTKAYGFNADGVQRIVRAVKQYEGGQTAAAQDIGTPNTGLQCIVAVLGSRGSDITKYSWSQVRRNGGGWQTIGLTGTDTDRPAIDPTIAPTDTGTQSLSGQHAVLMRGTLYDGSDTKPCWYITGFLYVWPTGLKKFMVPQMTSDATGTGGSIPGNWGWDWPLIHGS